MLFGPDVDPHLFRPTRDDVAALTAASIVFHSGYGLEAGLEPTLAKVANSGTTVVALAAEVADESEPIERAARASSIPICGWTWLGARCCDVIASTLPVSGARERADALREDLLGLDAEVGTAIGPSRSDRAS